MVKLLVIEDETCLREEIADNLMFNGFEVISAADGAEGIDRAYRDHPDLIICDVAMPYLDGYGVLLELRSHPETIDIPFIFLTARADKKDMRYGMDLGADDYILKPFRFEDLLRAIDVRLTKRAEAAARFQDEIEGLRDRLAAEHERRSYQSLFIAMVSHDLRNALAGILSSTQMLKHYADRVTPERRAAHLDRIEGSVHNTLQILDAMLILSQSEHGAFELQRRSFDILALCQQTIVDLMGVDEHTHHIETQTDGLANRFIAAEETLMRQIIGNLLSNAMKYSPAGSTITLSLENRDETFVLRVSDQGIGILEAEHDRLFEAFFRGSNTGSASGLGLGLLIVKQAVELHGGTVEFESQPGTGTTFTVRLPLEPAAVYQASA